MTRTDSAIRCDLLLKGGHVIDPASGRNGAADVAIRDKRIVAVADAIPTTGADKVLDVSGFYVTPGIIDMHAHVYITHRESDLSILPEAHTFPNGVTTVVDAGTAGWKCFPELKTTVIDRSKVRVLAYVNIVGRGMGGDWEQDHREMQPKLAAAVAQEHPDCVVGIKAAHYWTRLPWDADHQPWTCVDRAVEAGVICGRPVMVDFWPRPPERSYPDLILQHLRPGDIHTHVFAQQFPVLDGNGKPSDFLFDARARGIIFDLGHGAGSFWFRNAVPAIEQGFVPDSISTDLHTGNINGPVYSMLATMNKLLAIGVPLQDVIAKSTVAPAREIGHPELGTLSVGSDGDVAVFRMADGDFAHYDCGRAMMPAKQRLECVLTVRSGSIVYNALALGLPFWREAPPAYWVVPPLQR
jgi:dihydroorotase